MSSCSDVDLKAYILGESTAEESRAVKAHAVACAACGDELQRLRATQASLMCLREEELPRRIAFVSDREAAPAWWQIRRLLPNFAVPAMAALALIAAVAIPAMRTQPAALVVQIAPPAAPANAETNVEKRIQAAVAKAVADSEARQQKQTAEMVAAADKRHNLELRSMQVSFEEGLRLQMKQLGTMYVALNRMDDGSGR